VVQQMVKNELVEAVSLHIESVVPEFETFIENRESMIPPAKFTPVDLSADHIDHLDLFSEIRPPIGMGVCIQGEKMALSREENA
jgi:hypothetical protein